LALQAPCGMATPPFVRPLWVLPERSRRKPPKVGGQIRRSLLPKTRRAGYTRSRDIPKGGRMQGRGGAIRRWAAAASATVTLGFLMVGGAAPAVTSTLGVIRPAVTYDFQFIATGKTPPTED